MVSTQLSAVKGVRWLLDIEINGASANPETSDFKCGRSSRPCSVVTNGRLELPKQRYVDPIQVAMNDIEIVCAAGHAIEQSGER